MLKFKDTKVTIADKIYYNGYPFKVSVEGNHWRHDAYRMAEMYDYLSTLNWYKTVQRNNLSVYLMDKKTVEEFEHFFKDIIIDISCPYSNAVLKEMKRDKYVVRENLYYNKYRYRIQLGSWYIRKSNHKKMAQTLTSMYRPDSNRVYTSSSGWTHIMYTNQKHDMAKLRLMANKDTLIDFKECKLYEEI